MRTLTAYSTTLPSLLAICFCLSAQDKFEFWPGASYDPSVPTEKQVLGHDPGDRVSSPEEIVKYMEALAAARPRQMRVFDYAKTWEGRRLIYCALSSEANLRRLDEIRAGMKQLADPRKTPEAEARRIMTRMPAVCGSPMASMATKFPRTTRP